jgi:hypothetical protein
MADMRPHSDVYPIITEQAVAAVVAVRIIFADGQEAAVAVPAPVEGRFAVLTVVAGVPAWGLLPATVVLDGLGLGTSLGTSLGRD